MYEAFTFGVYMKGREPEWAHPKLIVGICPNIQKLNLKVKYALVGNMRFLSTYEFFPP